jgi:hypothetical protein
MRRGRLRPSAKVSVPRRKIEQADIATTQTTRPRAGFLKRLINVNNVVEWCVFAGWLADNAKIDRGKLRRNLRLASCEGENHQSLIIRVALRLRRRSSFYLISIVNLFITVKVLARCGAARPQWCGLHGGRAKMCLARMLLWRAAAP